MSALATVETTSRWETSSLLRKLRGRNAYAIQVDRTHWLVRSPVDAEPGAVAELEALVAEWAAEEGALPPVVRLGSDSARAPVAR